MGNELLDKSLCDIIAEIRALSNTISDGIIAINGRSIADRLDRARMKMENEMANLRKENAKMREALTRVKKIAASYINCHDDEIDRVMTEIVATCDAALATPRHLEAASLQDASAN